MERLRDMELGIGYNIVNDIAKYLPQILKQFPNKQCCSLRCVRLVEPNAPELRAFQEKSLPHQFLESIHNFS